MENKNHLPNKQTSSSLPMIQITTTIDLLKCKPVFLQVKEYSHQTVVKTIAGFLIKCSSQLGLSFDPRFIEVLSEDVLDKYKYDSLEDIAECLKKGRQGFYGTSYNKLTMIVITEWMNKHLEDKANARERHIKQKYQTTKEPLNVVDYEKFKARISEKKAKISKPLNEELNEYIEKVCIAMDVEPKELMSATRVKRVADVRGLIKSYQNQVLKMTREQIKDYWNVCSDKV